MNNIHAVVKRQFSNLFLITALLLVTLPLFLTSQDLITKLLDVTRLSIVIQNYIIPLEVKFVVAILQLFGVAAIGDTRLIVLEGATGGSFRAQIIWSCIGWQSIILLLLTLITGFRGNYTTGSRLETIAIGAMGTFWLNIIRIVIIYLLGYHFGQLPAVLFHNFAGTIMTIFWLFFFWWFSYSFVLEERSSGLTSQDSAQPLDAARG